MVRKYFGTDGIRGRANSGAMTAEKVLKVAMAAALELNRGSHRHKVVIAKDTRLSGYMLEPALTSGFISMGMDVVLVGPLPTPAVAMLTRSLRADLGVMISASHNPYFDNGIKLFGADGYKLSDESEERIEKYMEGDFSDKLADPAKIGRATRLEDASGRYIEYVKNTFPKGQRLDGLKIVIDCAHGAAYKVAPRILWELGATTIPMGVYPDGLNINKNCGATSPAALQEAVVRNGADIGISLDGDADRVFICDETGHVVDGDQIMALIATMWHKKNNLDNAGVVATVMSNLGLENYLKSIGSHLKRTKVGDRHVVAEMRGSGYNLGGEQSGHIILGDYSSTGDGLIAALQVLSVVQSLKKPVSEICRVFEPYPQILKNITYQSDVSLDDKAIVDIVKNFEKELGNTGRILIRRSGTEPLIRVMVEGADKSKIINIAEEICDVIKSVDNDMMPLAV